MTQHASSSDPMEMTRAVDRSRRRERLSWLVGAGWIVVVGAGITVFHQYLRAFSDDRDLVIKARDEYVSVGARLRDIDSAASEARTLARTAQSTVTELKPRVDEAREQAAAISRLREENRAEFESLRESVKELKARAPALDDLDKRVASVAAAAQSSDRSMLEQRRRLDALELRGAGVAQEQVQRMVELAIRGSNRDLIERLGALEARIKKLEARVGPG